MRFGLLPSQRDALREAFADQRRRLTRRTWAAAFASLAVGSAGGFWAGVRNTPNTTTADSDWLQAVAKGPLTELRAQAMHVIAALERAPDASPVWLGFHRLVAMSLAHRDDTALRTRLLGLARTSNCMHAKSAAQLLAQ